MHITTKSGKKIVMSSNDEDAEITKQAIEDGSHHTDEDLAQFKPASEFKEMTAVLKTAGRPKSDNHKKPVSIRLSSEVVDYFKSTGKGWQTRMDEVLKEYVSHH